MIGAAKWLLCLGVAWLALSCTATGIDAVGASCASDSDCESDLVCRQAFCATAQTKSFDLGFRLIPSNDSTLQPQTLPTSVVSNDEPISIALIPSVRASGRVLFVNDQNQVRSDGPLGILSFRKTSGISTPSKQVRLDSDSRYDVLLLPGTYQINFVPDDPQTPPRTWRDIEISLDTDPQLTVPARQITVSGTILDAGLPLRSTGLAAASVVAVAEDGTVSTSDTTDDSGNFQIQIAPAEKTYGLRISATENVGTTFDIKSALECDISRCRNLLGADDQFLVQLESLLDERFATEVELVGDLEQLRGATLELQSTFSWGSLNQRVQVTNSTRLEFLLPLGDWNAIFRPTQESGLSAIESVIEVSGDTPKHVLEPRPQRVVELRLVSSEMPLAGARVEIRKIQHEAESMVLTSGDNGEIEILLDDVADYRILVTPGTSNLSRSVLVASSDELVASSLIEVPLGAAIWGYVLEAPSSENDWVGSADVTVQATQDVAGEQLTVGEANTRTDGYFRMLVPAAPITLR